MSELFSLLQEEDKYSKDLYLKHLNQNDDYYDSMVSNIQNLIQKVGTLSNLIEKSGVEIQESYAEHFDHIHAQYRSDENDHYVWINLLWIERYSRYMSEEQAKEMHIAHELYHYLETQEDMWYSKMKRRFRQRYSEVSAIYFSQLISGLPYHPYLYEYQSKIHDKELDYEQVVLYLKEG